MKSDKLKILISSQQANIENAKRQELADMLIVCPECGGDNSGEQCNCEYEWKLLTKNRMRQQAICKHCFCRYASPWWYGVKL